MEVQTLGEAEAFKETGTLAIHGRLQVGGRATPTHWQPVFTCAEYRVTSTTALPSCPRGKMENGPPPGLLGQLQKSAGGPVPTWPWWSGHHQHLEPEPRSGCLVVEVVIHW